MTLAVARVVVLILALDLVRRVHGARDTFVHRQAYKAWMTFLLCIAATVGGEVLTTIYPVEDDSTIRGVLVGLRLGAITSLWIALIISMPGSAGARVLEKTRFGVKGPTSIQPLKPAEPAKHAQTNHSQSA